MQVSLTTSMQEDMILTAGEYLVATLKVALLRRQLMVTRTVYIGAVAVSILLMVRWLRHRR